MKVILSQDVKGQGKKGQLIEVSDGYARNYLLPRKLAIQATADSMNAMKLQEKAKAAQQEREKQQAVEISKRLESCQVRVSAKSGSGDKLFGSVTSGEISDALREQYGIEIDKKKIVIDEPIKHYGSFEIKCKLGYEVTGTIFVLVTEG